MGNGFVALVHGFVEESVKQCRLVCGLLGELAELVALCAVEHALEVGDALRHTECLCLQGLVLDG